MSEGVFQGSLFSSDFLQESISRLPDWSHFDDAAIEALRLDLRRIFDRFPTAQFPNESQTEDDLIWPILTRLGWTESLRQQNLAPRGREDVPDGLSSRTTQRRGKPTPSRRSEGATNSAWPSSNRKDGEGRSTISGHDGGLFALSEQERRHWLKVFALVFARPAFLPTPSDRRTFHQRALQEARYYEQRVATNLSNLVFGQVFPALARAVADRWH